MTPEHGVPFGKALEAVLPAYEIPADDLVGEVLIPAMREADEVRIAAGFFTSRCLAQIAPGLAALLDRPAAKVNLLISPEIEADDRDAIDRGLHDPSEALNSFVIELLSDAGQSSTEVARHCVTCLSYLVAAGRMDIRFVLMQEGAYHKKQWLIRDDAAWLAIHGSGNATLRGLLLNGEQMTIDRAWKDGDVASDRVDRFVKQFDRQWDNQSPHSLTVPAEQALAFLKACVRPDQPIPTVADFWRAWLADHKAGLEPGLPPNAFPPSVSQRLRIPTGLSWREGPFAHQGRAVDSFLAHGRGVFSIATGGGKTKAALISATLLQDREQGNCLVIVLTPSRPLVRQWEKELASFGVHAAVLSGATPHERAGQLDAIEAAFKGDVAHTEAIIATGSLFGSDAPFRSWITRMADEGTTFLIADEVHNLGTASFLDHEPVTIPFRLGLSATPIRQYDTEGTYALLSYFGDVLVEFSLGDAIRAKCLVPYDYHAHLVEMSPGEFDLYQDITLRLRRLGFTVDDDGTVQGLSSAVEGLLRKRRAIIEHAESKLDSLKKILRQGKIGQVRRTLIYASAKPSPVAGPRQIDRLNEILADLDVISHQLTSVETSNSTSEDILAAFGRGDYQVLTAMKVLDEGVDIPQTETAFLLASSTVRREWTQRRGRILRAWPGKSLARLHDFVVVPPDLEDDVARRLLRSELTRVTEFGRFSRNEFDPDGAAEVERHLEGLLKR